MKLTKRFGRIGFALAVVSLTAFSVSAQEKKVSEKNVPAAVITAFKSAYPNATITGYAREKEKGKVFYEIESKDGDTQRDVLYNPDGSVAEVEETITEGDLPFAALELIRTKHVGAVITKVERTTIGDKVEYEVAIRRYGKRTTLEFDADGNLKTKAK